jgi:chromosomal replication initiation ATPase DnaA
MPTDPRDEALRQLALELGHDPSHHEADFFPGPGNRLALQHVLAYPNWAGPLALLFGPSGSGKSHLAQIWADRSGARVLEPGSLAGVSSDEPLVLEDVDRPGYDEDALFHLLNQSIRDGRPVLLTARTLIADWPYRTDDLKSRARLAAPFTLSPPIDTQLTQILAKLFSDRQVGVDPRVLAYVAQRMERSAEEASELVELMDRLALARGTAVTRAVARDALALRRAVRGEIDSDEAAAEGDSDE